MEHRFYKKSKKEQNKIQVIIALSALAIVLLFLWVSWKMEIYLIGIFTLALLLSIVAPFFDIPALKKNGRLIYHSPLFVTERPKNGVIKIHGGSLFDYFFTIEKEMNGNKRVNFIIQKYVEGLLSFIEKNENAEKTDLKIRGTTYIINERTVEKIGFRIIKTDYLQKGILLFNYFNILISNSIAKKQISFPNLNNTKTFEADINQLIERKKYIAELNNKLKSSIADN